MKEAVYADVGRPKNTRQKQVTSSFPSALPVPTSLNSSIVHQRPISPMSPLSATLSAVTLASLSTQNTNDEPMSQSSNAPVVHEPVVEPFSPPNSRPNLRNARQLRNNSMVDDASNNWNTPVRYTPIGQLIAVSRDHCK